jgi:hypothetical protein
LQWGGDLSGGEIYTNSLRIKLGAADNTSEAIEAWCTENLEDVADDVQEFIEDSAAHLSSGVTLRFVKLNSIGATGHYTSATETNVKFYEGTPPHGTGTVNMPPSVAVVATLKTAAMRGRASKGRIFVPALNVAMNGNDGVMNNSYPTDIAGAVGDLITRINNQAGIDFPDYPAVSVVSKLGSPGVHRPVTSVVVDERTDTQRRRSQGIQSIRHESVVE